MAKLQGTVVAIPQAGAAPEWPWGCMDVGEGSLALGRPRLLNRGRIDIGDHVVVDSRMFPAELVTGPGGLIVIGAGTVVRHGVMLFAQLLIDVGRRVTIGPHCIVSDSDFTDAAARGSCVGARSIRIADEVVLGDRVTVKAGAIIGARSQILSGSVVRGEIPPGVVACGTPARPIRTVASAVVPNLA